MKRTCRQVESFPRRSEQHPARGLQPAVRLEPPARRASIAGIVARESRTLPAASAFDEGAHCGGIRTRVSGRKAAESHGRDVHVEVNAVGKGT